MDIREIERALQKPGKSRIGLAAALNRSPSVVTEMLRNDGKRRLIKANEIPVIVEYLELEPVVPIVGSAGAASEEVYYYGDADDPADHAPAPKGASPDTVAIDIRGDSLGPGLNGWLAYYDRREEPMTQGLIGRLCVVGLADGRVLIKIPKQAPGKRYHLEPNAGGEVIFDAKVTWAARVIHLQPKG